MNFVVRQKRDGYLSFGCLLYGEAFSDDVEAGEVYIKMSATSESVNAIKLSNSVGCKFSTGTGVVKLKQTKEAVFEEI